jgi:hypothetical protein
MRVPRNSNANSKVVSGSARNPKVSRLSSVAERDFHVSGPVFVFQFAGDAYLRLAAAVDINVAGADMNAQFASRLEGCLEAALTVGTVSLGKRQEREQDAAGRDSAYGFHRDVNTEYAPGCQEVPLYGNVVSHGRPP